MVFITFLLKRGGMPPAWRKDNPKIATRTQSRADSHPARSAALRGCEAIDGDYRSRAARPSQHDHGRDSTCRLFRAVAWPWNHRTMARKPRAPRPVPSTKGYAEWRTRVQAELRRRDIPVGYLRERELRNLFIASATPEEAADRA